MTNRPNILIPRPLQTGDTVGIASLAGPVDPARLERGIEFLRGIGLKPKLGKRVLARRGYLGGSDEERIGDFHVMLHDPEVRAVVFSRGGYGSPRLLDRLDTGILRSSPKLLVGMSDLTALQLSLYRSIGLVTAAGPMPAGQIAGGLDEASERALVRALFEPIVGRDLFDGVTDTVTVIRPGSASGPLLGGCLSLVTALLGTDHSPDYRGAVLLLEDVNEPLYRIDRMLTHLRSAGVLEGISGLVLGHFTGPKDRDQSMEVAEIVLELTECWDLPIVAGFPHGHLLPNVTVPIGVPVHLDTGAMVLRVDSTQEPGAAARL